MSDEQPRTDDTPDADPVADDIGDPRLSKVRAEAKNLRTRLRDAETERDRLREQVTGWQRAQAEQLAGTKLANGADLWAGGVDLPALLNEDGQVDPAKVTDAATAIVRDRPHWSGFRPMDDGGVRSAHTPSERTWAGLFEQAMRPT